MKKHLSLSILILTVALTACQAQDEDPFLVEDIGPVSPLLDLFSADVENCTVVLQPSAPTPVVDSIYAPVSEADWVTGAESPSITFITYSDFQCPFCAVMADYLAQLHAEYPEDVQIV
ncbi:MAG: thioredoxin domain-containing protein, partial [Chloroflexi bacterium]|nr:thioredoxin domain-containing protein [Chloroflexota bacterium]